MNRLTRYQRRRDLLSQLQDDFNRLLEPFSFRTHEGEGWPEARMSDWTPSIDVKEDKNTYLVHADVPGVKSSDIEVSMDNGVLTIKGKRASEEKEEKENYLRIERSSGTFMRQLTLPEPIDSEKIEATCREGVLEIKLPKATSKAGRKIEVKN